MYRLLFLLLMFFAGIGLACQSYAQRTAQPVVAAPLFTPPLKERVRAVRYDDGRQAPAGAISSRGRASPPMPR